MPDVFLSYNREDQAKAKLIAEALEADGISVWWDTVLRAGETYDEVTERHLRDSKAVVVLWSQRSVKSKWVRAEATLGERKSALVPAMIEPCERPILFELIQTADLSHWNGDHADPQWRGFLEDVRLRVNAAPAPAPQAAAAAAAAAAAPANAPRAADDSIESAFWTSVRDSEDVADFDSYLRRFPKGHFADLAQRRIAALKAPKPTPAPPPAPQPVAAPVAAAAPRRAGKKKKPSLALPVIGVLAAAALATAGVYLYPRYMAGAQTTQAAATPPQPAAPPAQETAAAPTAPTEAAPSAALQDCPSCPMLVRLPGGSFQMGSPDSERGRNPWEGPQHAVTVRPFAIGAYEVTFAQWDACVNEGGCNRFWPTDRGWGRGDRPVLGVSWDDANAYVRWLSNKTGRYYRLPTEAEWEYAARGGTATPYWWGDAFDSTRAPRGQTLPVTAMQVNALGLYGIGANVREWVEDCYVNTYVDAPTDGRAVAQGSCVQRVVRDGGWRSTPTESRIANRARFPRTARDTAVGFRVAATP